MTTFLTIFRRFSKIVPKESRTFPNILKIFSNDYRRFPKITEDFRGGTDDVSIIQEHIYVLFRDYVTIAIVIILVAMATPISSHVKDKNSIFNACDEDMTS